MQKLVAKIYLCLATKIIYVDSTEMEKHFNKTIYNINLCYLHNIITTSEYNSSAQAGYKSIRTESRKVKHLRSGSIEAKHLQLHRQTRA
jgi:hypothetical protein